VPHPDFKDEDKGFEPMYDLAGVKSWTAFAKHALSVDFSADDEWLTIQPWKNEGSKQGFVPVSGVSVRVPIQSPLTDIGDAVKRAFALCEPHKPYPNA
jgi:hypothetical protein